VLLGAGLQVINKQGTKIKEDYGTETRPNKKSSRTSEQQNSVGTDRLLERYQEDQRGGWRL